MTTDTTPNPGKLLASHRKRVLKTCPVCGTEFEGFTHQKYDRSVCQVKASRAKTKAEAEANKPEK